LVLIAVVVLVIIALLSGLLFFLSPDGTFAEVESISLGLVGNEIDSLFYIADDQRYFAANGLNVTIKDYVSGAAAVNCMLNGEVDVAVGAEFVFVTKVLENQNILTIGSIDKFFNEYVVARKDLGINNIQDLEGKKLGVSLGTSTQFFFGRFLELNGMSLNQVIQVDVSPPQTPIVLANGTFEAVIAWQPDINTIEDLLGDMVVMWHAQGDSRELKRRETI
jgi:NitT/TauT family transport system substrate-binding protein